MRATSARSRVGPALALHDCDARRRSGRARGRRAAARAAAAGDGSCATCACDVPLLGRAALLEELRLDGRDAGRCSSQSSAAASRGPRYSSLGSRPRGPTPRGLGDLPLEPQALAVLVEPRLQLRPLADEGFVRHLDAALVDRDEPRVDQASTIAPPGPRRRPAGELGECARRRVSSVPSPGLDQPQQQRCERPLRPSSPSRRRRPSSRWPRSRRRWRGRRRG